MIELTDVTKVFTLTKDQRKIVGSAELRPKLFTAVDSISLKCNSSKVFAFDLVQMVQGKRQHSE